MAVNADRDRARALTVAGDFGPEALTLNRRPAAALPDAVEVAVTRPGLASHHPGREAGIATTAARAAPSRHRESARISGSFSFTVFWRLAAAGCRLHLEVPLPDLEDGRVDDQLEARRYWWMWYSGYG